MQKTVLLIIASAAATFSVPAAAAVEIAPTPAEYSYTADVEASDINSVLSTTQNLNKRRSFRRGFRSRGHRGFNGRHRGFSHHRGVLGKKRHFKRNLKHSRHHDRFQHHDRHRKNSRFLKHDRFDHDGHAQRGHHDHHTHRDHHDGKGKIVVKKKDIVFHPHG